MIRPFSKSLLLFPLVIALFSSPSAGIARMPSLPFSLHAGISKDTLISELATALKSEFDLWYPLTIDTVYGGYFSDVNYKWELEGRQVKMIVTQARHVWSNSNGSMYYGTKEPYYTDARYGYHFLENEMWDKVDGGFYDFVSREGKPLGFRGDTAKTAYGNAFAIYGLATYFQAFGDTGALNLAIKTFNWLDQHSYDPKYGGYFQNLEVDGTPHKDWYRGTPPKDQNSMIHIMEAFTELYTVWPDPTLKARLDMLFHEVRDIVVGNKGYMTLFFNRDWTPVSYRDSSGESFRKNFELDHISFGHDVETAYLLLETSKTLGYANDTATIRVARQLDEFALDNGWDREKGGIYDGGYIFKGRDSVTIVLPTKEWWSQIEALNSFLMMSEMFPRDKHDYYNKFLTQWNYIKTYLIDHGYGGWYWGGIDEAPNVQKGPKLTIWKCNYHTTRGLMNCIRRLAGKL